MVNIREVKCKGSVAMALAICIRLKLTAKAMLIALAISIIVEVRQIITPIIFCAKDCIMYGAPSFDASELLAPYLYCSNLSRKARNGPAPRSLPAAWSIPSSQSIIYF